MLWRPGTAGSFSGTEEFDLTAGCVTGVRWWWLRAPDFRANPLDADGFTGRGLLRGATDYPWVPGVNEAGCDRVAPPDLSHLPPVEDCGCGFWAYKSFRTHQITSRRLGILPVCGIIEGTGRTLGGTLGFRCQRARIVALHLPFRLVSVEPHFLTGQEAEDRAEAWMAVIGDWLGRAYQDASIFATRDAMLAAYPPRIH